MRLYGSEELKDCYFSIKSHYGPARADIARYLIMYFHGGLYLDERFLLGRPDLLEQCAPIQHDVLFVLWGNENSMGKLVSDYSDRKDICNGVLFSEKRHPIWIHVLDEIVFRYRWLSRGTVEKETVRESRRIVDCFRKRQEEKK